ncbi:MAG: T9SS type A sorting domain-containing protein [Chitinophagales bacterium]
MKPKLLAYSSAAAAMLATVREGKSQIIYTDIEPDSVCIADPDNDFDGMVYDGYSLFYLDLDGNGSNDIRFKIFGYTASYDWGSGYETGVFAAIKQEQNSFRFAGGVDSGPFFCCTPAFYNYYSVSNFSQGKLIDASAQWTHGGWGTGGNAALYFSQYIVEGLSTEGLSNGGMWGDAVINDRYIAFKKQVGANSKYGWIRLSTEHIPRTAGVLGSMYYKLTVHDYAINNTINDPLYAGEGLPECLVPVPYDAIAITMVSAKVKWAPVYAADNYQVYYRPVGAGTWQKTNAATNQKKLLGLLCNTNYEWKVRTKCDGATTTFSTIENFTTAACRLTDETSQTEITIFPNPVNNILSIDVAEITDEAFNIEISDMAGKTIVTSITEPVEDILRVDVSNIPAGIYFITIQSIGFKQTLKFIKQ